MKKITELTPEQAQRLPVFRDEMLAKGLETGPCDHAKIEDAVRRVYQCAGYEPPSIIVWMSSPLGGAFAASLFAGGQLGDQLGDQLRDQLRGQLRDQLRDQLGDQLRDQLGDQLWGQLGGQLWDQLWGQLGSQLGSQLGDQLGRAVYGQHDLYWLAWLKFGIDIGVEVEKKQSNWLDAMIDVSDSGWWWPFEGAVILTERPSVLNRDNEGRLHCESGPATIYEDGWGVWAIHGVRVSEEIVMNPESITVEQILKEENAEVRRVMCERMVWDVFIDKAGLTMVDECDDPGNSPNKVRLYDTPEQVLGVPIRLMLVTNATPERDGRIRNFGLTVPAEIETALEAVAWSFDVPIDTYRELSRAT